MTKNCGNCAFANHEDAGMGLVFCTCPTSWHAHRLMPIYESCIVWTLEDQEPPADVLEQASREPGGESDGERETRLLTERGGRVGGTW